MCEHSVVYEFLRDLGSFIAGILALIAGFLAYYAGYRQAKAARDAAAAQVEAIRAQRDQAHADAQDEINALRKQAATAQRRAEAAEWGRRVQIVKLLGAESTRLARLGRDRLELTRKRYGESLDKAINTDVAPYFIESRSILRQVDAISFSGYQIMPAASILNAMVDVLDSALTSAGVLGELTGSALIGHLENVIKAAQKLREHLERWEAENPAAI
jgi:hypothetical protein